MDNISYKLHKLYFQVFFLAIAASLIGYSGCNDSELPEFYKTNTPVPDEVSSQNATVSVSEAVATEVVTSTETSTMTPTETSTMTPTVTSTMTPMETSTLAPTETPTLVPTETPTLVPTNTPTVASLFDRPEITRLEVVPISVLEIEWQWPYALEGSWFFAVRLWPVDGSRPRKSLTWIKETNHRLQVENSEYPEGDYFVNVAVLNSLGGEDHVIIIESEPFVISIPKNVILPTIPSLPNP